MLYRILFCHSCSRHAIHNDAGCIPCHRRPMTMHEIASAAMDLGINLVGDPVVTRADEPEW